MTIKTENKENPESEKSLLHFEEQAILSQIATKEPPHSLRAQAILAIYDGATQAEAGRQAGLTQGQVRYWLNKFRADRVFIFPQEMWNQVEEEAADSSSSKTEPIASTDLTELEREAGAEDAQQDLSNVEEITGPVDDALVQRKSASKAKNKPKKKTKKSKKSKKTKKTKKGKKLKKGKKPKKKGSNKTKGAKSKSSKKSKKKNKK